MGEWTNQGEGTVLVTGGSGFLGGWCITRLLERGHRVRATLRSGRNGAEIRRTIAPDVEPSRLEFVEADLGDDAGWPAAVAGCRYVLHVASPFPASQPKDPDELIVPARDGALRVVRAALAAGAERIVMTSSVAAMRHTGPGHSGPYTEADWTDPALPGTGPYPASKTIAERAAWDLVRGSGDEDRLAVVNPSAILGPVQGRESSTSLQIIGRMLKGMPGVPRLGFSFVDVRDVADLHLTAMTSPAAGGERFIASGPFHWLSEIAEILRRELPDLGSKAPTRTVPKPLVRVMGMFDPSVRAIVGDLGKESHFSTEKARSRLGWTARPIEETVRDCALSLAAGEDR